MGFTGFCRQHFGYGRGAWQFHHARAARGTGRLEVEGGFYLKCFREPFRTRPPRRAVALVTLLGVWQLANTAGFFYEAMRQRAHSVTPERLAARAPSSAAALRPLATEEAGAG
jgi:hypothetical protein